MSLNQLCYENLAQIQRFPFFLKGMQAVKPLSIETQGYESAIRIFLQQNLQLASEALECVPAKEREINTTILAVNPRGVSFKILMISEM